MDLPLAIENSRNDISVVTLMKDEEHIRLRVVSTIHSFRLPGYEVYECG